MPRLIVNPTSANRRSWRSAAARSILRDWRRNEVITISPRTIDLVWELHEDLGSKQPVHIVSGYRSPKTNAFLKKIGRNVARKSQHMVGKAIETYQAILDIDASDRAAIFATVLMRH